MWLKSFRRRSKGFLKSPEERERTRIPWGKYIYFGILVLLVAVFCNWGYQRLLYIKGEGRLEAKTTTVEAKLTSRITGLRCNLNDMVSKGESLVFLDKSELAYKLATKQRELVEKKNSFQQKIMDEERELTLLKQAKKNWRAAVGDLKQGYQRAQELFAAAVITRPQLLEIDDKLKQAQRELLIVSIKTAATEKKLAALREQYENYQKNLEREIKELNNLLKETALLAPEDGLITMVYKQVGEIAQAGEPLLTIANPSESFIKTYFDESYENAIKIGDEVRVVFANGKKTKGAIRKIYPAALPPPPEFRKLYNSLKRSIVAEIVPTHENSWYGIMQTKATVLLRRW